MGCTDYDGMFNNMGVGHQFLRDTFAPLDVMPRVGWSLDPFGISSTQAIFYSLMGMDTYVFTRLPKHTVTQMQANKSLEFNWEASASLTPEKSSIFAHVLESYYCSPVDYRFNSANVQPNATEVVKLAKELTQIALDRAPWFATNNVLIPWGCDYMYQEASQVYKPTEEIMELVNKNTSVSGVSVRYGSPAEYFNALHASKQSPWPVARTYPDAPKSDIATNGDFFPYIPNDKTGAWSGYFTSRGILKRLSREAHSDLYIADRLDVFSKSPVANNSKITAIRRKLGIVQHHDAITGSPCSAEEGCMSDQATGEHDVLGNYEAMCTDSMQLSSEVMAAELELGGSSTPQAHLNFINRLVDGQNATLVIHNPMPSTYSEVVSVKIPFCAVAVTDKATGAAVHTQVTVDKAVSDGSNYYYTLHMVVSMSSYETRAFNVDPCVASAMCDTPGPERTSDPCYGRVVPEAISHQPKRVAHHNLNVNKCPALNFVDEGDDELINRIRSKCEAEKPPPPPLVSIENSFLKLVVNTTTGPVQLVDKTTGTVHPFTHELKLYKNSIGNAYFFSPTLNAEPILPPTGAKTTAVIEGKVVSEIRMALTDQHKVFYKLWQSTDPNVGNRLEVGYRTGIIDQNSDLSAVFSTDIKNDRVLYSESNGYEVLRRQPDTRLADPLAIAANFFPSQMSFFIKDSTNQLSVAVDRSRAVGSLRPGQAEILIHRRSLNEHSGAVVNDDVNRITSSTWVSLGPVQQTNRIRQQMKLRMSHPIRPFYLSTTASVPAGSVNVGSFPEQIHLQSVRRDSNGTNTAIIRFMHTYSKGEDTVLSAPVTINMVPYFAGFGKKIVTVTEMTASGMVPLASVHRRSWNATAAASSIDPTSVLMGPMDVRTFSVFMQNM
eukprot:TRINITY_DN16849_c0_g1_i1.p1 TRINITY_DN16849_c0_g1~~TRINITY_DN16849_c0_g1_i1.p1  ORF type:complete len:1010 (+),score=170.03 TRINITY_DN16849_c0_g1_i1:366-3032(+)